MKSDAGSGTLDDTIWRSGIGLFCAFTAHLLLAGTTSAQAADQEEFEQIVVTGSRIARPDFETASPIVSIPADAFERTADSSVDTVINRLPQFTPDITSSSNNPGNGGQGNVQLRGLGATSTLVLLDGRRLIPANGNGVVDVSIIPGALVESVEIVSGGASAVYGSDAIAGVVNFKLKDKFTGIRFDGGWGQTEQGDGTVYTAGITAGHDFAGGRGNSYGHVGYSERDSVFQGQRELSEVALGYFGPGAGGTGPDGGFLPLGSSTIAEGTSRFLTPSQSAFDALFASYGYAPGTIPLDFNNFGFNPDGSLFTTGNGDPGSVANLRGEQDPHLVNDRRYTYNFAPWNYLLLPRERTSAFARASLEIAPAAEVYGQALYVDYTADTALAPTPAMALFLPLTNPYIPDDLKLLLNSREEPQEDLQMARRLTELGPRISSNQHDVFEVTVGSRGRVFGGWEYDAYVQTGAYDSTETQAGNALRSKILELTYAPDGGVAACGGLDLFGAGSISDECARYIAAGGTNREGFDQTIAEASLTGVAVSLSAGEVRFALGVMHKRDEYFYQADPIGSVILDDGLEDIQGFSATDDIEGSDHNTDVYVEALVPILRDIPAARRLEGVLGFRHSEYASAGGVDAYKAELLYEPVQPLRIRSSFQHAVRAPSVFELYQPLLPTEYFAFEDDNGFVDPCTAGSAQRSGADAAQVAELCLAQGVPAERLPNFADSDDVNRGVYGGNPDLGPEAADTLTAGLVLRSWTERPRLSDMWLSLDWYHIEMNDAIVQVSAQDYVGLCFDRRVNPNFDVNQELCDYFSRDPGTGEIVDLRDIYQNIVGYDVSGIDAQFDWSFPLGAGEAGVNWLVSWMDYFKSTEAQGLPPFDEAGHVGNFIGGSLPRWKWNLNASYAWDALTLAVEWRYVDGMRDRDLEDFCVPSQDYLDVFGSYEFTQGMLDGLTLRGGIENLTDEDPPLLPSPVEANTDPSQYDVLGRRYHVSLSYDF